MAAAHGKREPEALVHQAKVMLAVVIQAQAIIKVVGAVVAPVLLV